MTAAPTPAKPPPTTAIEKRVWLIALTLSGSDELARGGQQAADQRHRLPARQGRAAAQEAQAAAVPALLRPRRTLDHPRGAAVDHDVAREALRARRRHPLRRRPRHRG